MDIKKIDARKLHIALLEGIPGQQEIQVLDTGKICLRLLNEQPQPSECVVTIIDPWDSYCEEMYDRDISLSAYIANPSVIRQEIMAHPEVWSATKVYDALCLIGIYAGVTK